MQVYWGYPLRPVSNRGYDLQDDGVHFNVVLAVF